jgi:L-malate glycosyltransferase
MTSSTPSLSQSGAGESCAKPRIFLLINTLERGGSERQFVTLANSLDRERFQVSLGCLKLFGQFSSDVCGLIEFSPGGHLFGVQAWRSRLALARLLRKEQVSVAHAFDFYSNLMLIPAARFARVPVVLGSHRQLGDLLTPTQFRFQAAAFRFCDRVVCNSHAAATRLQKAGIRSQKIRIIPNGLPAEFLERSVSALSPEPQVLRIGMISRMNHRLKNHVSFLRIAATLASRFPQVRFVLVGDGPLRAELETFTRQLGISDRTLFLGDRRDIPAVLAALDISVLPSSSESLSNVILESMAIGVPVVAADIGGNSELVQHGKTGLLFCLGDEAAFASALERLITQPELRKSFGAYAREMVRSEYTAAKIRDRYQELYYSLLAGKGWTTLASLERLDKRLEPAATSQSYR